MIYHFFHVYAINHWEVLVDEHLSNIIQSGLYDAMEAMEIGFIGDEESLKILEKKIFALPKVTIKSTSQSKELYEYHTLRLIEKKCEELKEPFYIYYSHTKGVSFSPEHPAHIGGRTWFEYMEHFNCKKWKDAVYVLDFGYDTYGIKLIAKRVSPSETTHYSGNSFWCKSDYAKTWGKIDKLDIKNRFGAETLLCGQNSPIMFTACQLFVDYICSNTFKTLLDGGYVKEFKLG